MPLSNIFSASTSNAFYKPKIVMENNNATQPAKEMVDVSQSVESVNCNIIGCIGFEGPFLDLIELGNGRANSFRHHFYSMMSL